MFAELLPVLQDTMVTVTKSRIDDQLLRVNIIPKEAHKYPPRKYSFTNGTRIERSYRSTCIRRWWDRMQQIMTLLCGDGELLSV